jgi:23S rRNA (cytidine1920-2'-O)/16S rRNA (cytidine1409-2'-O)-methyltransferase
LKKNSLKKTRLDLFLAERGMVESRNLAQRIIMAGEVRVNGEIVDKPSTQILESDEVIIKSQPRFVSRGGEKLDAGILAFGLTNLNGLVCADVGSSTGGFTDCLLQHGAKTVFTIDVGNGLLHWKLRNDPRVILMEKTNARYILELPQKIDLATIDASFISLKTLLPVVKKWLIDEGAIIALVKPQFEAGREISAHGKGVIRDPEIHLKILKDIILFSYDSGFQIKGVIASPIIGPKGNREFLIYLSYPRHSQEKGETIIERMILNNGFLEL